MRVIVRKPTIRQQISEAVQSAGASNVTNVYLTADEWQQYVEEMKNSGGPSRYHPDRIKDVERRGQDLWQHDGYCFNIRPESLEQVGERS